MKFNRVIKFTLLTVVLITLGAVAAVVGVLMFGGPPMDSGSTLADGRVTLAVDRRGPVRIGAYVVELADGGYALVDTGMDPAAGEILSILEGRGASASDVRALFLTHAHGDHAGGMGAFPGATVYAMAADAEVLRTQGLVVQGLADGESIAVGGTVVEAFALPGHTAGSAAYLVHGVLFLGDAAAATSESSLDSNDVAFTDYAARNRASLHALANRVGTRGDDLRLLAFGHQGPVQGLGPLLDLDGLTSNSPDTLAAALLSVSGVLADTKFGSLLYLDRERTASSLNFGDVLLEAVTDVQRLID